MYKWLFNRLLNLDNDPTEIRYLSDYDKHLLPKLPDASRGKTEGDIIFLTPDPWNQHRWARKQMFAYLSQAYFGKVLYCVDHRQSGTTKPTMQRITENLILYNQGVGTNVWHRNVENIVFQNLVRVIRKVELRPKAIIAYQSRNSVLAHKVVKEIGGDCKVFYDLTDDWTDFPGFSDAQRKDLLLKEEEAIKNADKVFSVSIKLFEWSKKNNPNTVYLPNATDFELMKTTQEDGPIADELKHFKRPIFGYTGRITPWRIDWALLEKIASMEEEPTVVMIGEVHPQSIPLRDKLMEKKNVTFLGPREYYKLPTYYRGFDCCILPHSINNQTASMDPIKLYDYMGSGRPIVTMAVNEAMKFSDVLYIANDHEHFLNLLSKTWQTKDHNPKPQMEIARQNSWTVRVEELVNQITETILAKKP